MKTLKPDIDLSAGEEIVRFDNVVLQYGQLDDLGPAILKDVTFSLDHGSFHFLTGQSGAGKSTLLKLLYLGLKPTQGLIRMFGKDVHKLTRVELPYVRRRIGIVFQDFRLIPHLTALENVALPLVIGGMKKDAIREHVADLLNWVGLEDKVNQLPATLSGGEQQRVAIARAVITKPGLLLADEPTGNVDDKMAMRILYLLEQLNKMGTTVLIATHNDHLIEQFDYPQIHLEKGKISHV